MKFTRRDFLRTSLAIGTGALIARPVPVQAMAPGEMAVVEGSDPEKMLRRALDLLGGIQRFITPGDKVVIKPNASFANPEAWANNTNPRVVAAVCRAVQQAGARMVTVVDYPLMRGAEALQINGVAPACANLPGVGLRVLASQDEFRKVPIPGAKVLHEVEVAREVLDADVLINVPVAKAHDAVAASIGLKNLMGVIWDRTAFHTMMEINQAIADLARVVRPDLTLVDMTRVMVTNGPKGPGEVATPNLLVATSDPVAADSFCLTQVRFNGRKFRPTQLRYMQFAHAAGLGEIDVKKLKLHRDKA